MGCCLSTEPAQKLTKCTYDNTPPYAPHFNECYVVKVYDGDTVHVAAIPNGSTTPFRFCIRMLGYDAPEMRDKNLVIRGAAERAKQALEQRVAGKVIHVEISDEKDKYGRLLGTLYDSEGCINTWMVDHGHGKPYDGGKKVAFTIEDCVTKK